MGNFAENLNLGNRFRPPPEHNSRAKKFKPVHKLNYYSNNSVKSILGFIFAYFSYSPVILKEFGAQRGVEGLAYAFRNLTLISIVKCVSNYTIIIFGVMV